MVHIVQLLDWMAGGPRPAALRDVAARDAPSEGVAA
jgi:hypothetical protein